MSQKLQTRLARPNEETKMEVKKAKEARIYP
jgi:hypothetical protein